MLVKNCHGIMGKTWKTFPNSTSLYFPKKSERPKIRFQFISQPKKYFHDIFHISVCILRVENMFLSFGSEHFPLTL